MEATASGEGAITVRWTMEAADMLGGSMLYQRRRWLILRVAAIAALVIGFVLLAIGSNIGTWLPFLFAAAFLGVIIVIGPRRSVKRQGRSLIGEPVVFSVDERGAHQDLAGGHVWTEWWALTEALDNASTIVIKRDRLPSFYIPKRAFATGADAEAFLTYVRSHLGPKWPASEVSHRPAPPSKP
jgi:hypothetical protein